VIDEEKLFRNFYVVMRADGGGEDLFSEVFGHWQGWSVRLVVLAKRFVWHLLYTEGAFLILESVRAVLCRGCD